MRCKQNTPKRLHVRCRCKRKWQKRLHVCCRCKRKVSKRLYVMAKLNNKIFINDTYHHTNYTCLCKGRINRVNHFELVKDS